MAKLDSRHIDEMAALLAVDMAHSFVAAGKAVERHPTIISKRIASLEARLGVRLVERTTRQVHLTDAGKRLADKFRAAADLIAEAQQEASETAEDLRGCLKLALPATMGRMWLAPRLPGFMAMHPKLELDLHFSDAFVDLVDGGFDAAIRIGHLADSRLVARKLADHQRVLAASPGYIERHGMPSAPADLLSHNCIGNPRLQSYPVWRLFDGIRVETVRTGGTLRTNDSMAMVEAARAGIGILGAGEWLLGRDLSAGTLVRILPRWIFDGEGGIYLVRPSRRYAPARTDAFAAWVINLFDSLHWAEPASAAAGRNNVPVAP